MPTLEMEEKHASGAVGEFAALEQKILRAVEMLRAERESLHAAEAEVARLSEGAMGDRKRFVEMERELEVLRRDRQEVKSRVEKMLEQLDELGGR